MGRKLKTALNIIFVIGMIAFAIAGWTRPEPEPDCTRWQFGKIVQGEKKPIYEGAWFCIEGRLSK